MKEKLKERKGITLIALVITIIVLLILAGVSISMLAGDNGILIQAKEAKEETRGGTVQEARDLWFAENKMNKELNKTKEKTLEDLINELVNDKHLTEDEKDIILGNASKGIEAQYQITIGSHVINFKDDENREPDYAKLEAGLYETGTSKLIKSWEQLIIDGDIVVNPTCTGGLYVYKGTSDLKGTLVIKEGITEITNFRESKLEYVKFPSTLYRIHASAFENCTSLKIVEFPIKEIYIDYWAFKGCNDLLKLKGIGSVVGLKMSTIDESGNELLRKAIQKNEDNYMVYAANIINNLSTDENTRNQEITDIYIDGFTYIEKAKGNLPEDVKIESLQELWEFSGQEGECPFNNVVEVIEAEGGSYEDLISMMIEQFYVKPKEFDQNN